METFTSTDLKKTTGRVLDAVQHGNIVSITNRNRGTMALVSHEFLVDLISLAIESECSQGLDGVYKEYMETVKEWEK